uniref:WAT1-related protein n=1 Tax=Ananas comosus var. bracteatus TaxID=296719 RepID=A0A6V7PJW8_ANACO|nr:unnamed protein product [Ananas comosus var. bracteatus]
MKMVVGQGNGGKVCSEVVVISGLFAIQCVLGFYMVFLNHILSIGVDPLFVVVLAGFASAVVLLPFAVAFERKKWPTKYGPTLVGGHFQVLMMQGIEKTSPAIASAMPNLAPGLIFIIAACLRMEKFERKCKFTRVKILGTLAAALVSFPAPLSLCVITSMMGSFFTALLQIIMDGKLNLGSSDHFRVEYMLEIILVGGVVVGASVAFQTWCVGKKGPVLVSMFSPIQTVFSAVLSAALLGQVIGLGSLAGIVLMFSGLYIVLWAKSNEIPDLLEVTPAPAANDVEKHLLF